MTISMDFKVICIDFDNCRENERVKERKNENKTEKTYPHTHMTYDDGDFSSQRNWADDADFNSNENIENFASCYFFHDSWSFILYSILKYI